MRTLKLIMAAALAVATTGCVESMDSYQPSSGGYGYADSGYYAPSGYYASSGYYAPTYVAPRTEVIREVRTVPVPVQQARSSRDQRDISQRQPQQHEADRSSDRSGNRSHQNDNRGSQSTGANNGSSDHGSYGQRQQGQGGGHGNQDRDGDGRPDR